MNKVTLVGKITKELELKTSSSGTEYLNFSVACKRRFKNNKGEYESDFISCTAFKAAAKTLSSYFTKGDSVGIVGELRSRSYEKDGQKHYITEVYVEEVHFVAPKKAAPVEKQEEEAIAEDGLDLPFEF